MLDLVQVLRQLTPGTDIRADDIREDFFVRGTEAELPVVAVLQAEQFRSVLIPAAGFLPQFRRLQRRHQDLLRAGSVHLLAHDLLDLAERTPAERHEAVYPGDQFADHARSRQQDMARDLRLRRYFTQCFEVHLRHSHNMYSLLLFISLSL